MKRTKLSNGLIFTKIVLIFFFVVFVAVTIDQFDLKAFVIGALIFSVFLCVIFLLPDKIEFDEINMYVINRNGERVVGLKDVYGIATTGMRLNYSLNLMKIYYFYKGEECTARFYPLFFSKSLKQFTNVVKKENPAARVDTFWLF